MRKKCLPLHSVPGGGLSSAGLGCISGGRQRLCYIYAFAALRPYNATKTRDTPCCNERPYLLKEALGAFEKLVLKGTNQAATWTTFFSYQQSQDMSVSNVSGQCAQLAADWRFHCPHCQGDLSEYVLLRKLMGGLSDEVLKREVFQVCNQFQRLGALRTFCSTYEAVARDTNKMAPHTGHSSDIMEVAGMESTAPGVGEVAGARLPIAHPTSNPTPRPNASPFIPAETRCGNCGTLHTPGKAQCPARSL